MVITSFSPVSVFGSFPQWIRLKCNFANARKWVGTKYSVAWLHLIERFKPIPILEMFRRCSFDLKQGSKRRVDCAQGMCFSPA